MDTPELSEFDIAITGGIKAVIEVLAAKGIATHEEFAIPFRVQLQSAREANLAAAVIFEMLLHYCEKRGPLHTLGRTPPAGSA